MSIVYFYLFIKILNIMKNVKFFFAAFMLLVASCSNDESLDSSVNPSNEQSALTPVTVHVSDFSISVEEFSGGTTRAAQAAADYAGVKAITLAFYKADGTEAYKTTQTKNDADFGEFSLSLPMGSYTMVAVAYTTKEGSPFVLTSATEAAYTGDHVYETFTATQLVTISNTNAVDISATLSRVVSMLTVVSSDGKTADVSNVRMTFSAGGKDFNPTTGLAITNTGFANTVGVSAAVGATSTSSSYLFLATDEQDIDVTIETLDADGNTLFSRTIEDVPFKRNRKTKLTGAMYTNTGLAGNFQVTTDWITEHPMGF